MIPGSRSNLEHRAKRTIRFAELPEAEIAAEILAEAAEWTLKFGPPIWSPEEICVDKIREAAAAGALILGEERCSIVACMQIFDCDPTHWPGDALPALYLHKLAVRRSASGRGWLEDLIYWALRHAKNKKARLLRLDTMPAGPLPELYAQFGFHAVDPKPLLINGRLLVRMERWVGWGVRRSFG